MQQTTLIITDQPEAMCAKYADQLADGAVHIVRPFGSLMSSRFTNIELHGLVFTPRLLEWLQTHVAHNFGPNYRPSYKTIYRR